MIPVRLKVLSSSSCSLSEASSLLQRFLSSDACSDSLAREYVANVAQALQDSISRRAEKSGGTHSIHRHFPSSSQLFSPSSKVLVDGKQSSPSPAVTKLHGLEGLADRHNKGKPVIAAGGNGEAAGSLLIEAENAHPRHKKKRRHSGIEKDTATVFASTREAEDSPLMYHDKKRRKKEKNEVRTEHVETEDNTLDNQRWRNKEASERGTDHIEAELVSPDDQNKRKKKEKNDRGAEEKDVVGGGRFATENVTPDIRKHHEKKKKDRQETEAHSIIEASTPVLDDRIRSEKKKRKKEKQGNDAVTTETLHANGLGSRSTWVERFDLKSITKGKKKQDASSVDASRFLEASVFDTHVSLIKDDKAGAFKRKKGENAGLLATPDKIAFTNVNKKIDAQALPLKFGSVDSEEKKLKKKKRKRKEEPEFD